MKTHKESISCICIKTSQLNNEFFGFLRAKKLVNIRKKFNIVVETNVLNEIQNGNKAFEVKITDEYNSPEKRRNTNLDMLLKNHIGTFVGNYLKYEQKNLFSFLFFTNSSPKINDILGIFFKRWVVNSNYTDALMLEF